MAWTWHFVRRAAGLVGLGALVAFRSLPAPAETLTNFTVRVLAANLTSGTDQKYETPGLNILAGLKPDVVAIQEFNYSNNTTAQIREMIDSTLGTNFVYFREANAGYSIPNGVISRHPFLASGSWVDSDSGVNDRGFAWARIDLPGTNDLYVVSVHLKANSDSAARRAAQASELKALISTNFPANAWIIVAGDFNLHSDTEAALVTLKTFLSDSPIPVDLNGDPDTNRGRDERYDRVLASFSLTNTLTPVLMPSRTLPNGLVFVSTNYMPLSDVVPIRYSDSTANGMQHMGVVKDFRIPCTVTDPATPPAITNQPQSLTVTQGDNATFAVGAGGTAPLRYQWQFNSNNIVGATTNSYTRTNVQPADVGAYSVVVTNAAGRVTSSNALLSLHIAAPTLTLAAPGRLEWQGLSNLTYTVQARTSLETGSWQAIGTATSPTANIVFTNQDVAAPQRFFRVVHP